MISKKGFTLIEIIVSISLIAFVGLVSFIGINNIKKNNSNIESITNKILGAANVFVEVENDTNGNNYMKEINSGRNGLKIPLKTLVNKGYIDESDANIIYNNYKEDKTLELGEDYFVLLSFNSEQCKTGGFQYIASWKMNENEPVYLCKDIEVSDTPTNKILFDNTVKLDIPDLDNYQDSDKGLYILPDKDGNSIYYYGKVENNYFKYKNMLWRIVRINGDGTIRLVLDDILKIELTKASLKTAYDSSYKREGIIGSEATSDKIKIMDYPANITLYKFIYSDWKVADTYLSNYKGEFSVDFKEFDDYDYFNYREKWYKDNIGNDNEDIAPQYIQSVSHSISDYNYDEKNFYIPSNGKSTEFMDLSRKEIILSGGKNSYLNNISNFYLAETWYVPGQNKNKGVYLSNGEFGNVMLNSCSIWICPSYLKYYGDYAYECSSTCTIYASRPVINLNKDIKIKGTGIITDPYVIDSEL